MIYTEQQSIYADDDKIQNYGLQLDKLVSYTKF